MPKKQKKKQKESDLPKRAGYHDANVKLPCERTEKKKKKNKTPGLPGKSEGKKLETHMQESSTGLEGTQRHSKMTVARKISALRNRPMLQKQFTCPSINSWEKVRPEKKFGSTQSRRSSPGCVGREGGPDEGWVEKRPTGAVTGGR